jgi:hypothetical protein
MAEEKFPYTPAPEDEEFKNDPPVSSWQSNIPAFIGFIILVIIVIWGLVHLVVLAKPWMSSVFPRASVTPAPIARTTSSSTVSAPITTQIVAPQSPAPHKVSYMPSTASGGMRSPADLVVHIFAIGIIDPVTGQFINRSPASSSDMVAVQFDIANIGDVSTGLWHFNAQLPTGASTGGYGGIQSGYLYTSPAQTPLGPGDHIINTLRFTQIAPGGGMFQVIVDPRGEVYETNKSNNTDQVFVSIPAYHQ